MEEGRGGFQNFKREKLPERDLQEGRIILEWIVKKNVSTRGIGLIRLRDYLRDFLNEVLNLLDPKLLINASNVWFDDWSIRFGARSMKRSTYTKL